MLSTNTRVALGFPAEDMSVTVTKTTRPVSNPLTSLPLCLNVSSQALATLPSLPAAGSCMGFPLYLTA